MDSFTAEILRYLNSIKTEESLVRNIEKVIQAYRVGDQKDYPLLFVVRNETQP